MATHLSSVSASSPIADPPVKVKPAVEEEVLTSIAPNTLEDAFVYVHCHCDTCGFVGGVRIWKTTFLIDATSGTRSPLLHAENISYAPQWTLLPEGNPYSFLLIFSGLPKSCLKFDLLEEIPQAGGFFVKDIPRNETDVYHVDVV